MVEKFIGSPDPTVGVEIELQLVDRKSRELISICPEILRRLDGEDWLKSELLQSTIEINSRVCKNVHEVRDDLAAKLDRLREVADDCGVALASAGTHPFSKWEDQKITRRIATDASCIACSGPHVDFSFSDSMCTSEFPMVTRQSRSLVISRTGCRICSR